MPKPAKQDLSSLYPRPKSFDELKAEREQRQLMRRPRNVPLKVSAHILGLLVLPVLIYGIVSYIVARNLSSTGVVMFSVSLSILATLAIVAILFYMVAAIKNLISAVLIEVTRVYVTLSVIVLSAGIVWGVSAQHFGINLWLSVLVLLFAGMSSYFVTSYAIQRQG